MRTDVDAAQLRRLAAKTDHLEITAEEALDLADALDAYYLLQEYEDKSGTFDE